MAVNINDYTYETDEGEIVLSKSDAQRYATAIAKEVQKAYEQAGAKATDKTNKLNSTTGESTMATKSILGDLKSGASEAAQNILTETEASTALITGEILLDNIETLADKLVLSRLSWFQRITISKKNKELAVTLATYAIVHAIKTGGFGLTKYRIDHSILRFVTLAANQRLLKAVVAATGVNTNIAGMILSVPTVTKIMEGSAE